MQRTASRRGCPAGEAAERFLLDGSPDPPARRPLTSLLQWSPGASTPSRSHHGSPSWKPPRSLEAALCRVSSGALRLMGAQKPPQSPTYPSWALGFPAAPSPPPSGPIGQTRGTPTGRWPQPPALARPPESAPPRSPARPPSDTRLHTHPQTQRTMTTHAGTPSCGTPDLHTRAAPRRPSTHRLSFSRISGLVISFFRSSKVCADDRLQ